MGLWPQVPGRQEDGALCAPVHPGGGIGRMDSARGRQEGARSENPGGPRQDSGCRCACVEPQLDAERLRTLTGHVGAPDLGEAPGGAGSGAVGRVRTS